MDVDGFRTAARETVDQICEYHRFLSDRPVTANVAPGYLRPLLPTSAPLDPEPFEGIVADIQTKILPGMTHWASPRFMGFFPSNASYPSALADMWSGALNGPYFNWACSPAATELETIVMDWTALLIGLPRIFSSQGPTGGGGVIMGMASESILTVMVAARDRFLDARLGPLPADDDGDDTDDAVAQARRDERWQLCSRLVAVGSAGTHSSTRKAARILGLRYVSVPVREEHSFALQGGDLAVALDGLAARGLEPFFLTVTIGTTDVCAVDDLSAITNALAPRRDTAANVWVHVDAAYAGSALVLDDYKPLVAGPVAHFHSFNFNPHKWLFTTFDCSALWVRDRVSLTSVFSTKPAYLRNAASDAGAVIDYRDWHIPLGRRFRALKLWFVLRSFGIRGLQARVRAGITRAESLEHRLRSRPDLFTVFTPARFGLVTLRLAADEATVDAGTRLLYYALTARADFYLTSTVVIGKFVIRACTTGAAVADEHVDQLFGQLVECAEEVLASAHLLSHWPTTNVAVTP